MSAAVCSSRRVKRETDSLLPPAAGPLPLAGSIERVVNNANGTATVHLTPAKTLADFSTTPGTLTPLVWWSGSNGAGKGGTRVAGTDGTTTVTVSCGTGTRYFVGGFANSVGDSEHSAQASQTIT